MGAGDRLCLRGGLTWLCLAAVSPFRLEPAQSKFGRAYGHCIVDLSLLLLQLCICSSLEGIYREGFAAGRLLVERGCKAVVTPN